MGGVWRSMSREDWQRLERRMGTGAMASQHHGWRAGGIVAVTLGAVLLVGLAAIGVLAVLRHRWQQPPAAHAP